MAASLAAAVLMVASASPEAARAQQAPPTAATVAAWVQTFYDQTQSMNARFVQRYRNRVYQRTDESRGRVRFKKPGMMRFDYDQPNGKVVVSDGEHLLVYEPPDGGQGPGQHYEQDIGDAQLPAALSFLTGTGRLEDQFRFRLLDGSRLGTTHQVLELRSIRPTAHYSRILLFVDQHPQRRGVVHRVLIIDSANNRNSFDFESPQHNGSMASSLFRWRPPAGSRRVQP